MASHLQYKHALNHSKAFYMIKVILLQNLWERNFATHFAVTQSKLFAKVESDKEHLSNISFLTQSLCYM